MIFVNLPVKDLPSSVGFFTSLGFDFNPQFTDKNATCMVLSEQGFVMLLAEDFFKTFTSKGIADTGTHTETLIALSAESRDEVDDLVDKALAAGAKPGDESHDEDFMYGRSFEDLDGHTWSFMWMDPAAIAG
ncbi:MAG TPA: VOC family protein [Marmoricola sp.]|nr:VOC family protein [Marmoricola sp.]